MTEQGKANLVLTMNTLAFTVCFAAWMLNGVLVTYLVDKGVFHWDQAQIGWLIGIPVLTGSVMRLPLGLLTDKYGGRIVYTILLLLSATTMYLLSYANTYSQFLWASLGFGLSGASFAVGIAYSSIWFDKKSQGTALGIFGVGNAGSALTSMGAPFLLQSLTDHGANLEGWRHLPKIYAAILGVMALLFWLLTYSKKVEQAEPKTLMQRLTPLKNVRVWRFGLYYFLVFGGFVGLAQWLIPYYVNAYAMTVTTAGLVASIFSLPSGVIRALGGWMSDKWGARKVMYWVFGSCLACFFVMIFPNMEIFTAGEGIMAKNTGKVTLVTDTEIKVGERSYPIAQSPQANLDGEPAMDASFVLPRLKSWQKPVVEAGDEVVKKQLLAQGFTKIDYQLNVWVFTALVFIVGIMMGIGKAGVYKYIPDYFPQDVGVVGGLVGVLGGLGGFFTPILFGYLLKGTGIWNSAWVFFFFLTVGCLAWMHSVVKKLEAERFSKAERSLLEAQPLSSPQRMD